MIEKFEYYSSSQDGVWWDYHPTKSDLLEKIEEMIDKINELEEKLNENKITK